MVSLLENAFTFAAGFYGVCRIAVDVAQLVVVGIRDSEGKFLRGNGFVSSRDSRHEVVHIIHHIAVLIDVHRVLVKLEAAPYLTHFTGLYRQLVVEFPTGHHDVGSFREVVLTTGLVGFVESMAETIE